MHVVLEALELKVQYRRERFEADTLLRILQTEPFSVVLVLAFESLDLDVVFEGLFQIA